MPLCHCPSLPECDKPLSRKVSPEGAKGRTAAKLVDQSGGSFRGLDSPIHMLMGWQGLCVCVCVPACLRVHIEGATPAENTVQGSNIRGNSATRASHPGRFLRVDTMRVLLWNVLLFCLLAYAFSDCRRDCLNCHRHLYSHQQDDFSLLICVMECEGKLLSSATWGLCSKATGGKPPLPLDLDSLEDDASQPLEMWNAGLLPSRGDLKHLGSLARAGDLDKAGGEKGASKTSGLFRQVEGGDADGVQSLLRDLPAQLDVPKGVSGFLRGPFGYEPVGEAGVQELQKRFGGFIGVRKSARKWHNQKRFSQFLKQYLGMSPRSVEYDGLADDPKEQNEI